MSSIRILPDRVANQIAAGEVIERPAAVVKELVENSLDSGAGRIEVEFRNGGKSYIRVEDNGSGMDSADAMMCLESHATSKIKEADDLMSIDSFGFRGEALPSISSVSRFTLRTRREEDECGTEVCVNGGKILHKKECGMASGTVIEVAHLFNSVPARRKFLKTDNTEAAHIVQLVRLFAMGHPKKSFQLKENGRVIFRSPGCQDLKERLSEVWSRSVAREVVELSEQAGDGMRMHGLLGKPGSGRSSRHDMQCFVNGRPVDSRTMGYAIIESYHTYLPKGRYPIAFLFFEISPSSVDVNVHPSKREVRFRDEGGVRRFIINVLTGKLKQLATNVLPQVPAPEIKDSASRAAEHLEAQRRINAKHQAHILPVVDLPKVPKIRDVELDTCVEKSPSTVETQDQHASEAPIKELPPASIPMKFDWRFIGMVFKPRLMGVFETRSGVVMLNCRAAHERVCFEKIQKQFQEGESRSQPLLIPIPLELDPVSSSALEEYLDYFKSQGIVLSTFGRNFYRIEALPEWLEEDQGEAFVRDLVSLVREQDIDFANKNILHDKIAAIAARKAVRMGDNPGEEELLHLAKNLLMCENPLLCPSGQKTYFEVLHSEADKRFGALLAKQNMKQWL